jgi:hypothetical protein
MRPGVAYFRAEALALHSNPSGSGTFASLGPHFLTWTLGCNGQPGGKKRPTGLVLNLGLGWMPWSCPAQDSKEHFFSKKLTAAHTPHSQATTYYTLHILLTHHTIYTLYTPHTSYKPHPQTHTTQHTRVHTYHTHTPSRSCIPHMPRAHHIIHTTPTDLTRKVYTHAHTTRTIHPITHVHTTLSPSPHTGYHTSPSNILFTFKHREAGDHYQGTI